LSLSNTASPLRYRWQPARLLVVSHLHFEELLSLLPDFRAYINRSTRMAGAYNQKRDVTLEQVIGLADCLSDCFSGCLLIAFLAALLIALLVAF